MFPRETDKDDRRRIERSRGGDGRLRRNAAFAAVFVAGFLFGWWYTRDGDDRTSSGKAEKLGEVAGRIRSRAIPAELDPRQTAGSDRSTFVNPTVRIASGQKAQPRSGRENESQSDASGQKDQSRSGQENESQSDESELQTDGTGATVPDVEPSQLVAPTTRGMPMLGVGTYQDADYDECVENVRTALQMGYRHVDATEQREAYYVEEAVGDAIDATDVDREDLFVATKVSPEDLVYDDVLTSAEESFDRLGVDFVDLLYVHWPTGDYDPSDTFDAFAELREEGLIERIGVSNFTVDLLEEAIEVAEEPIFANQVEMHPLLPQTELREFCAQDDVDVELVAYSPIARDDVADVTALQEVADKHDATPEQVSLAWLREKDVTAIPKSTNTDHLRQNWLSLDVDLDAEDVEKIDAIEKRERIVDPDDAPWNQ